MTYLNWLGLPLVPMTDDELDNISDHAIDCANCYLTTKALLDEVYRLRESVAFLISIGWRA